MAYEKTFQKVFADVDNALISREKVKKKFNAENERVASYKKYKHFSWAKYNEGYSPYLEVLFAKSQLYPAELSAKQT